MFNYISSGIITFSGTHALGISPDVSGGFVFHGSANTCMSTCEICKFAKGSIVYSKRHAIRGKLNKVFVKKVQMLTTSKSNSYSGSGNICIYFDRLNEVYNEEDLVDLIEAMDLAEEYYLNQIAYCKLGNKKTC